MAKQSFLMNLASLFVFVVLCIAAAGLGSLATIPNLDPWYAQLRRPSWMPPSTLFGPVWTVLYLLMAVAAWLVWQRRHIHQDLVKPALGCWFFQLLLNAAWSWLFFGFHKTGLAFLEMIALWLMIAATIASFYKVSRPAAVLLIPYLAWVSFALVLNGTILRLN